jgi:uncharacterized membrane protein
MPLNDIFQLNDWNLRRFLILILSLMLAFWGSIAFDILIFPISLIRQIVGFLILRVLKVHHLGAVKTTVYATGLSISTLMFTGFFVNMVYPLLGISRPISFWPLVTTISALVGILCLLAWIRDQDFTTTAPVNPLRLLSPPMLALSLIPFGAVAGTYLMNFYDTNVLQMILLPVIAIIPVIIIYTRCIPEKYYPYIVFSLSITLLYHTALISTYIWGYDIQYEYYLTNTVIQNSFWDFTDYSSCNSMLSLVTLAPIYAILLNLRLEWVFKIIYPFLFALVPLGLYKVFQKQTNEKIAFLACFFFISIIVFFTEMLTLARQEVAELFLVVIILLIIDQDLSRRQKSALYILFSGSLVVSHYGISYLFLLLLLLALGIAFIEHHVCIRDRIICFSHWLQKKSGLVPRLTVRRVSFKPSIIPVPLVIWYAFFLFIWDLVIANLSTYNSVVSIGQSVLGHILSDLFSPSAAEGVAIIVHETTTLTREVTKYMHLLTILFVIVGLASAAIFGWGKDKFEIRYLLLSCGALCICVGGVALPYFASALNASRLYQISLIFLAPFAVIGGIALMSKLRGLSDSYGHALHVIAIFFGLYLLFNSGWISEVAHEESYFTLNRSIDAPVFSEQEIYGSLWLANMKDSRPVAADRYRGLLFEGIVGQPAVREIQVVNIDDRDYYVFIGQKNIHYKQFVVTQKVGVMKSKHFVQATGFYEGKKAIYSNGGSKIYI